MIIKRTIFALAWAVLLLFAGPATASDVERLSSPDWSGERADLPEPASLEASVAAGELPAVRDRLPQTPALYVPPPGRELGRSGGDLHTLVGRAKDTRLLVVYGYARLVAYDEQFELMADILHKVEVEEGRIFTFHLRPGHRWSDGHPFTAEDFRYYWEDVANNDALSPGGPPQALRVEGESARFEVIDDYTLRYSWDEPNPYFLPALAAATPLFIYRPAHYLKQLHEDHGDADEIARLVQDRGVRSWAALHNRLGNLYRFDNPALPTLQPWMLVTEPPSKRFVAARNPYYHRVDENGMQLPYLDRIILSVTGSLLIPAKAGSGESDLQARGLSFSDYTFLRANDEEHGYLVHLWDTVRGSQLALYPNLNANDPVWRAVLRDVRVRRALSLGVDRHEINQVIYFGLGDEGNQSVLPASPLYKPEYRKAWADHDPETANRLLDEAGLVRDPASGIRRLPDGRPMEIIVETAGENIEETDVLELIHDSWLRIGVKLYAKPSARDVLRNRIFAGDTIMAMWFGLENAVPTPSTSPAEFVPAQQHSYHWPKWGQYRETGGRSGEPVDMPMPQRLETLYEEWRLATRRAQRETIWREILEINAEEVYTIGLVANIPQPIVVRERLRNVPSKAIFNWSPGAQFGVYRPESFWLAE